MLTTVISIIMLCLLGYYDRKKIRIHDTLFRNFLSSKYIKKNTFSEGVGKGSCSMDLKFQFCKMKTSVLQDEEVCYVTICI